MDDTPLEVPYSDLFKPLHRIEKDDMWDYLKEKTHYVILFLCYLMRVEASERERSKIEPALYTKHYEIFTEDRLRKIVSSMIKYLNGLLELQNPDVAYYRLESWIKTISRE